MSTPNRAPDFEMSSARRPTPTPQAGSSNSYYYHQQEQQHQQQREQQQEPPPPPPPPHHHPHQAYQFSSGFASTPGGGGAGGGSGGGLDLSSVRMSATRENEQRYARIIAEAEYKVLEERSRAHEREAKLKEELAQEKAKIPRIVNERVEQILAERRRQDGMNNDSRSVNDGGSPQATSVEVERLKNQLQETQRLLADAERRYQQEKRELLNLRTSQLKNETSKRGQEGDIIGRAMQVMSEYETIVRASEENSLARLAHHMENFEKEWIRRSKEFEERKAEFEAVVMSKALEALKLHNQDVESIGAQLTDKTIDLLRSQGESRLELEQQVLEHAESFKQQYKDMIDAEFRERCRLYDEKIQERETNLVKLIQQEREKVIAAEKEAVKKSEEMHLQCLNEAMADISKLREQLVKEHQEQQAVALQELLDRREQMRREQNDMIEHANERVQQVERQCFEAVDAAQKSLKQMQLHMSEREAELTKKLLDTDTEKERERLQQLSEVREEVELHWKGIIEQMRQAHLHEVQRLTDELQERIDREHNEEFARELELRRALEAKAAKTEESIDLKWQKRLAEATRATERHLDVIQALREDNEQLSQQLGSLQQQFTLRESEFGSKINAIQREHEQVWHRKMEEMRQRYDKLLDEALGGPQGESVTRGEHEKVLETMRTLEERCVEMKRSESERLARERAQLSEMWRARLEQERAERAVWEEDQMKKLAELRIEIEADARRKEAELLRRAEQERMRLHEEATKRTLEDRRDRDSFEERLRDEYDVKLREAEDELNQAYSDKVRVLERRVEEKEIQLEKRRLDMKREVALLEEDAKKQAAMWLEQEKSEILRDVKLFHEKLIAEQQRVDEERSSFEQKLTLKYADKFEKAKVELQHRMLESTATHVEYWQRCEQEWLAFRNEEMALLYTLRTEHEQKIMMFAQGATEKALREANLVLQTERELLDEKETQLYAELEKARLAQEAASRERAVRLLDERNKIQEEAEQQRAIEEAKVWEQLEKKILEKERQAEADRRVLEVELRSRYESLINSERQRVDALMEQHRKEARELYEGHEMKIREREDEWHRQRLQIEIQEKDNHERQYQDLRAQCENRVADERARFEATLKVREAEFDSERQRILDGLEKQMRDHEASSRAQLNSLRSDYERRIKTMTQEMHQARQQYIADIAEQESNFEHSRDNYEAEAAKRFEKCINELRSQLEARSREHQARELEAKEALEKSRRQYEERINEQYEALLKDYEKKILDMHREHEDKAVVLEKEHQEHLLQVRHDMERSLTQYFSQTDTRAREAADTTRQQFQGKLDEYHELLAGERKKRLEVEANLHEAREELDSLRTSVEQHKLEIHRSIQAKFEKLFAEMREKQRQEREELARRMVEEEEKKLARELLRRDGEVRRENVSEINRSQSLWSGGNADTSAAAASGGGVRAHMTPASHMQGVGALGPVATPRHATTTTSTPAAAAAASGGRFGPGASSHHHHRQQQQQHADPAEDEHKGAVTDTVNKRRDRLQQLWQVLDYPVEQRNQFLSDIFNLTPHAMLETINSEIRRLEVQLPLLEVVTRREYLLHRLRELDGSGGHHRETEEFSRELARLTEHLKTEIPRHEQRYNSKFMFRGARYMDALLATGGDAHGGGAGGAGGGGGQDSSAYRTPRQW